MAFLQELQQWSADESSARPDDLFRVLMPVSMRTPDHDEISAANVVSYVFHSYRRRQLCHSESLLAAIHRKSYQMINRNEGAAMLHGFALTRWIPVLFRLSQKLQPNFASVVMTNVGEVRRVRILNQGLSTGIRTQLPRSGFCTWRWSVRGMRSRLPTRPP